MLLVEEKGPCITTVPVAVLRDGVFYQKRRDLNANTHPSFSSSGQTLDTGLIAGHWRMGKRRVMTRHSAVRDVHIVNARPDLMYEEALVAGSSHRGYLDLWED